MRSLRLTRPLSEDLNRALLCRDISEDHSSVLSLLGAPLFGPQLWFTLNPSVSVGFCLPPTTNRTFELRSIKRTRVRSEIDLMSPWYGSQPVSLWL